MDYKMQCQLCKTHTSYLSFLLHRQDFRKPNFTPKKTTKGTKNTKNVSEKVKYIHFFHSIWKKLHLTENFYTDMSVVSVTNMWYGKHLALAKKYKTHPHKEMKRGQTGSGWAAYKGLYGAGQKRGAYSQLRVPKNRSSISFLSSGMLLSQAAEMRCRS